MRTSRCAQAVLQKLGHDILNEKSAYDAIIQLVLYFFDDCQAVVMRFKVDHAQDLGGTKTVMNVRIRP
jgi:hypothetical protein